MHDAQLSQEVSLGCDVCAGCLGEEGVGEGSDGSCGRNGNEGHSPDPHRSSDSPVGPQVESPATLEPENGQSKHAEQEERVEQMGRYRNRSRQRGVIGNPLGEHDHGADQGFANDCDYRQGDAGTRRLTFGCGSPDHDGQRDNEKECYATESAVGELDGGGPFQFGNHVAITGGPRPSASSPAPGGSYQSTKKDHDDVAAQHEPGKSDSSGHRSRLGIGLLNAICHHPVVDLTPLLGQQSGYWLAGILTVLAAAVVTVIILVSSRSGGTGQ